MKSEKFFSHFLKLESCKKTINTGNLAFLMQWPIRVRQEKMKKNFR